MIRAVWEDGGRFDGWSEHFSFDRWMARRRGAGRQPVDVDWYTTRERERHEVLPVGPPRRRPRQASGCGRTGRTRCPRCEVEDCRWTPCFDCGVCPTMGTEIQIGPTGQKLLPLTVV